MPIVPIIFFVVASLLSVVINPYRKQAQDELMGKTSLEVQQREKPQKLETSYSKGILVLFTLALVVILTIFVTVLGYVPFE